ETTASNRTVKRYRVQLALIACIFAIQAHAVTPDWENEQVNARNRLPARSSLIPFASIDEALTSYPIFLPPFLQRLQLLDGDWRFQWVPRPEERPSNFPEQQFDDSAWDTISVPSNWEMHGYGTPIYV